MNNQKITTAQQVKHILRGVYPIHMLSCTSGVVVDTDLNRRHFQGGKLVRAEKNAQGQHTKSYYKYEDNSVLIVDGEGGSLKFKSGRVQ